jgi:hypothetical protein
MTNRSIHLEPDELSRLVVEAALNADEQGYWKQPRPIAEDAVKHLVAFLGLLLGGDDDVDATELNVLGEVFAAATGAHPSEAELRAAVNESVTVADDPDAVNAFLCTTPPFLAAVMAMDQERGTRNADQVVTALSGLALAVLAADGRAEVEEDAVFTTHLEHLRRELSTRGISVKD